MNLRISKKILSKSIRKSCNYFCLERNLNNGTCSQIKFYGTNENRGSHSLVSNYSWKPTFNHSSILLNVNFQRNLSSGSNVNTEKPVDSTTTDVSTDGTDIPISSEIINSISESNLVNLMKEALEVIHAETGLPWWATIAGAAFWARFTITFPLSIGQARLFYKMQIVNVELDKFRKKIMIDINQAQNKFGLSKYSFEENLEDAIRKEQKILIEKEKCHPIKSCFLILFQVPLWLSFTLATRKLCLPPEIGNNSEGAYQELSTESFVWVTDLTSTDPYFILPITICLVNLIIIKIHQYNSLFDDKMKREQIKVLCCKVLALITVPIATVLPVASNIYWLSSSIFGLLQALLIYSKPCRRLLKMPKLEKVKISINS